MPLPLNLERWIAEHRDVLRPPTGAKTIWQDTDFIVTVVGGPNDRPDYHDDPLEEFFHQIKGDMTLRVRDEGKRRDIPIREGEIYLLPPHVRHSPQRPEGTLGMIVERQRAPGVIDAFEWFCEACDAMIVRREVKVEALADDVGSMVEAWASDAGLRTCKHCGHVNPAGSTA